MSKCHECGSRSSKKVYCQVSRHGGGSYRRGGRGYSCILCLDCIHDLLKDFDPTSGHHNVGSQHYNAISLMYAAKRAVGDHTSLKEKPYQHPGKEFLDVGAGI